MKIVEFISGPWGVLIQKAILILLVVGSLFMIYRDITGQATQSQYLRDQTTQLAQLQKDNQDLQTKLDNLQKVNTSILTNLNKENQKVIETHDVVTHYIESPEAQQSNEQPVPDVIKNTIGMLRDQK
jgi:hypothetical protein